MKMRNDLKFQRVKNFLHSEWVEEGGDFEPLFNPSTGEVIGEVLISSAEMSESAVESSYAAYDSWRALPIGRRIAYLFEMRAAVARHSEELAFAIAIDQAKHISEARGEVQRAIQLIETACSIPTLIQGDTLDVVSGNINGRVIRQPLGAFGGIAPFNFPALVFGWFVPFAIGVGNTFIFKPSTQSPLFMQKMGDIFNEIGLPAGVINIVHGHREVPEVWYDHPKVSGVCLVGSTPTAKKIASRCGLAGKRSMLLGGAKNYLVVMQDACMDVFTENFIHSCYGSAGQRCLAGSIVAAVPEIYDRVLERILSASSKVKVGDALDPDVYMGPVISAEAKKKIERYIETGVEEGARLVLDGRNPPVPEKNRNGYFVGPTVFVDVDPSMKIMKEEIFGPVVCLIKIENLEDGLRQINDQRFGNGACIFTKSLYYTEKFIREAQVGMVGVNVGICAPHPFLPFGGIKDSLVGTDKVQGKGGIDFFTQAKVATIRFDSPRAEEEAEAPKCGAVRSCVAQ